MMYSVNIIEQHESLVGMIFFTIRLPDVDVTQQCIYLVDAKHDLLFALLLAVHLTNRFCNDLYKITKQLQLNYKGMLIAKIQITS